MNEGANGMSYDFGIAIARGTVAGLAATVAGVVALTGAIVGIVNSNTEMDNSINKNQIAFGGYANTLKAIEFANQKQMAGVGFSTDSIINGMKDLGRAGLDAKTNFDLVAEAANASGKDFQDIAGVIKGGDYGALAEMGIITGKMATNMDNMGYSAKRNTSEVLKLLNQAKGKGMFEGSVQTLEQIKSRFTAMKSLFVHGILGDPKDPEGLAYTVKKHLSMVANFLQKHSLRISYYGKMVGLVLRTIFRMVGDFVKFVAKHILGLDKVKEKSTKTMQDNLMSFGLWLEIQRARVRVFFEEYGKYIGWIVKALLVYKAIQFGSRLWSSALQGAVKYFRYINKAILHKKWQMRDFGRTVSSVWGAASQNGQKAMGAISGSMPAIMSGINSMKSGMMAFNVVAFLNPIGLIVLAVIAVIAAVVLLIAYWDDLWLAFQDMSDAWAGLLGPLFLVIKYWEEIKATVSNVFNSIQLWGLEVYLKFLGYWNDFKNFFVELWTGISDFFTGVWESISATFHEWFDPIINFMAEMFAPLIDAAKAAWGFLDEYLFTPISDFFTSIGTWIMDNIINPVSSFFSGIGDFFGNMFGGAVDSSNKMLQEQATNTNSQIDKQLAAGVITKEQADKFKGMTASTASKGMTNSDVQKIKVEKKAKMQAEKTAKQSQDAGTTGSASFTAPGSSAIDYQSKMPTSQGGGNTTNTTVASGAVQINVGAGANIDENKLATLVTKKLKELGYKNAMREGA